MDFSNASFKSIGIAGQIGSGKSTLANLLAVRLGGQRISFGRFVIDTANRQGLASDRQSLQELGENLIKELSAGVFLTQVLAPFDLGQNRLLIFDGVRHSQIWQAILNMSEKALLIYLDVAEIERQRRIEMRDNISIDAVKLDFNHPMELNVPMLKPLANIVLSAFSDPISNNLVVQIENMLL